MFGKKFDEKMLFSKAIRERLDAEAALSADLGTENETWFAVLVRQDGHIVIERNYDPNNRIEVVSVDDPPVHQILWAESMSRLLNRELHHDGAWLVAFTHPPGFSEMIRTEPNMEWRRVIKLWMDVDGDVAFTADLIDPFWQVMQISEHHFAEQSEESWQRWHTIMRGALAPKQSQLINFAEMKERGTA